MVNNQNAPIKVAVGKRYIDKKNCVVKIKKVSKTGWYISDQSSYREDGTCYHGSALDLHIAID
jgi:hypothetical protein